MNDRENKNDCMHLNLLFLELIAKIFASNECRKILKLAA